VLDVLGEALSTGLLTPTERAGPAHVRARADPPDAL
jgi:hypothetical protein